MIKNKNVGDTDKAIRLIAALILAYFGYSTGYSVLYVFAIILLATALLGWCGLYKLIGVNTCKVK